LKTEEAPRQFGAKIDVVQRSTTSVMGNKPMLWTTPRRF